MPSLGTNTLVCISGHWWWFPTACTDFDSAEFEWRDGRVYVLAPSGRSVEGTELSHADVEQLDREMLLADVLELAAARLRSGEGWDESTTADVLNEIEHATGSKETA